MSFRVAARNLSANSTGTGADSDSSEVVELPPIFDSGLRTDPLDNSSVRRDPIPSQTAREVT